MTTSIRFATAPRVRTRGTATDSPWFDQYFVHGKPLPANPDTALYLHADGRWRATVLNEEGKPTGYYETRRAAQVRLDAWRAREKAA